MKEIKDHIDEVHRNPLLCEDSSSESESSDESEVTDNAREVQLKKAKMVQVPLKNKSSNCLQCETCANSFTRKDNLSRHMKNKH